MSAPPNNANEGCPGTSTEGAGKAEACAGCPNQSACSSGAASAPDPAVAVVADRLRLVKHTILVLSGKGGVGKSTVSAQLAFTLSAAGFTVGLLDVDICGPSIPRMLGLVGQKVHQSASGWSPVWVDEALGVMSIGFMLPDQDDAVIWRGPRKNGLIKQFLTDVDWGTLDYLIIDTPPGTSDEHISIAQYLKGAPGVAGAVVVTTPQEVAMADVRKELNFCRKVGFAVLGVVENMSGFVCPCCKTRTDIFPAPRPRPAAAGEPASALDAPSATGPAGMAASFGVPYLGAVPIDPLLLSSCESGECYVTAHKGGAAVPALLNVVKAVVRNAMGNVAAAASRGADGGAAAAESEAVAVAAAVARVEALA